MMSTTGTPGVQGSPGTNSITKKAFIQSKGNTLGEMIQNFFAKIVDLITQLRENGALMYIILIAVGITIYYVLRYFIGLKLGRLQAQKKKKD